MEKLYKKFKGRLVEYPGDVSGIICGWVEDNLIIAIEGKNRYIPLGSLIRQLIMWRKFIKILNSNMPIVLSFPPKKVRK